jgi:hypothetical protein
MSGTRRVPIERATLTRIPAEAISIYCEMIRLRCTCKPYPNPKQWWGRKECRACEKWWELHNELADQILHKPWQWPLITPITRYPDYDREAGMFTNTLRRRQGNDRMRAMEKALRAASSSRKKERDTDAEPVAG